VTGHAKYLEKEEILERGETPLLPFRTAVFGWRDEDD
jgi:hypothetical protein